MYVLDSDVLTFVSGGRRNKNVSTWYDGIDENLIYLSVIAIAEKSKAAAIVAKKGNAAIARRVEQTLLTLKMMFADRILPLDVGAAEHWGRMLGERDKHGNDTAVAAIAKQHNYMVATRNVADYAGRGVTVINPFEAPPAVTTP